MPDFNRIARYYSSPPLGLGPTGPPIGALGELSVSLSELAAGTLAMRSIYSTPAQTFRTVPSTIGDLRSWVANDTVPYLNGHILIPLAWQFFVSVIDASSLVDVDVGDEIRVGIYNAEGTALITEFTITASSDGVPDPDGPHHAFIVFSEAEFTLEPTVDDSTELLGLRTDLAVKELGESDFDTLPQAPDTHSFWCAPASSVQDFGRLAIDISGEVSPVDQIRRSIRARFDRRLEGGGVIVYQGRTWSIAAVVTEDKERTMQIDLRA